MTLPKLGQRCRFDILVFIASSNEGRQRTRELVAVVQPGGDRSCGATNVERRDGRSNGASKVIGSLEDLGAVGVSCRCKVQESDCAIAADPNISR